MPIHYSTQEDKIGASLDYIHTHTHTHTDRETDRDRWGGIIGGKNNSKHVCEDVVTSAQVTVKAHRPTDLGQGYTYRCGSPRLAGLGKEGGHSAGHRYPRKH